MLYETHGISRFRRMYGDLRKAVDGKISTRGIDRFRNSNQRLFRLSLIACAGIAI